MRLLLSPSSSSRPSDDDHRVLLLRYFPRERRTHRFVVFFFFVVVVLENADCSCEQKATLFSATRRSSHSSSHATSSSRRRNTKRSYSTRAFEEENTFQRNARLLVPVLSSRRGLFARVPLICRQMMTVLRFIAFPRFFEVGFSLAENHRPRSLRSIFSFFFGSFSWSDTEMHFPRWTDNHEKKSRRTQN